jgi:Tetratricopeptide repeat.
MLDHQNNIGKNISLEPASPIAYLVLKSEGRAIEGKCQTPGVEFKKSAALFGKAESDDDITETLKSLFAACEKRPNVAQTYNLIGACYRHLGRPEMAIPFFRQALYLNPEYDFALTNMGLCCQEAGLMKSAEYYFEQEAVRKSTNMWVRGRYDKFHKKTSNYSQVQEKINLSPFS